MVFMVLARCINMVGCSDLVKIALFSGQFSLVEEYFLLPAAFPEIVAALAALSDLVAVKNILGDFIILLGIQNICL